MFCCSRYQVEAFLGAAGRNCFDNLIALQAVRCRCFKSVGFRGSDINVLSFGKILYTSCNESFFPNYISGIIEFVASGCNGVDDVFF